MATYRYLKCPHCRKNLGRVNNTNNLGNPYKQCPKCKGTYIDPYTSEWVTKSPFQRFMFKISFPLSVSVAFFVVAALVSVFIGSFLGSSKFPVIAIPVALVLAAGLFVLIFFMRKSKVQAMIEKSLERTKSETYVTLLQNANLRFYHIEGVEIGTEKDGFEESAQAEAETKEEPYSEDNF